MFQIVNHIVLLPRHEVAECDNPWPCDNWISHPCLLAKGRLSALIFLGGGTVCLRINGRRGAGEVERTKTFMRSCIM